MTTKKRLIVCLALVIVLAAAVGLVACQRIAVGNVVLNETYLEMNVGDTATLVATVDVDVIVNFTWTSSNSTVATVENGKITAIAAGATSVKAAVQGKVAVCTVVVFDNTPIEDDSPKVTQIILSQDELMLKVGQFARIYAIVYPVGIEYDRIVWTSVDTSVVTVSDYGYVSTFGAGTTTIIASIGDVVATCRVVVKNDYSDAFPNGPLNFATLKNEFDLVTGSVKEDSVCMFNFFTEIYCAPDATYQVYRDIECTEPVRSKVVTLQNGFNHFYIIATQDGKNTFYQVVIEQVPTFTVTLKVEGCEGVSAFCEDTNDNVGVYAEGEKVTINVSDIPLGYKFFGWRRADNAWILNNKNPTFDMPAYDVTYTAVVSVDERIANLDFEVTDEGFVINGFKEGADTSELVIPEYTARIKDNAFTPANKIEKVTWLATDCKGTKVDSTCSNTIFRKCEIGNLYLDKSVTKINDYLFYGIYSIDEFHYNGSIAEWCQIEFSYGGNPLTNRCKWYVDNELVENLVIPEGVTELKRYAFNGSLIKSVTFPRSLHTIGSVAFFSCSQLTTINWAEGLKTIDHQAFCYCRELAGRIVLPGTLETLDARVFGETKVSSIVIPRSVKSIGNILFDNCDNLKSVLYEGTYKQWLTFKENIGVKNDVLFAAKIYTTLTSDYVGDNPDGHYWAWGSESARIPALLT